MNDGGAKGLSIVAGSIASLLCSPSRELDAIERPSGAMAVGRKKGRSCAEPGAELKTTVDQTLIRGLVTAFRVYVSGLSSV
jgi:hypothetical protein